MIGGLGYQALGPLCVLAPGHCGATFAGLAHGFPAARGPPMPFRRIASGPIRSPSACNSRQTRRWARRWGRASPAVAESRAKGIQHARAYAHDRWCQRLKGSRSWFRPARTHAEPEAVCGRWCSVSIVAATLMTLFASVVTWLCVSARWRSAQEELLAKIATLRPGLRPEGVALRAVRLTGRDDPGTFGTWPMTSASGTGTC